VLGEPSFYSPDLHAVTKQEERGSKAAWGLGVDSAPRPGCGARLKQILGSAGHRDASRTASGPHSAGAPAGPSPKLKGPLTSYVKVILGHR
jgi:hypothetical protein